MPSVVVLSLVAAVTSLAALLLPVALFAVPAAPVVVILEQPDGTRFEARQWGDEWLHGWETVDGFAIVLDEASGWWAYARRSDEGILTASPERVEVDERPVDLPRHLRPTGRQVMRAQDLRAQGSGALVARAQATTGTANVPVILINFNDRSTTYTAANFNTLLFGTGNWSMKDYYQEVSYGVFSVSAGPGGVVGWYTAASGHDYYGSNVGGAAGDDAWPGDLVYEAVSAADAAGYNFAPYDGNGDCFVDTVMIVHQGQGEELGGYGAATDIWSHRWSLSNALAYGRSHYGTFTTNDSCLAGGFIKVNTYTIQPELSGTGMSTMGVYAHEYGHALGLPDLYDTDGSSEGVGKWSLMAGGSWCGVSRSGDRPSHMDPWSKYKLGWITPTQVSGTLTGEAITRVSESPDVYQFLAGSPATGGQYFLLENRQLYRFDAGLPGAGLLIWHVDEAKTNNTGECYPGGPSCASQHYKVAVEQADGLWELEKNIDRGDTGDPYPGSTGDTSFTGASTPSSALYSGSASGVGVTAISASAATMTATLSVSGGGGSEDVTIFSDDFEGSFPGSWTTDGVTTWGRSTYRKAGGSASVWCAAGGSAPQPAGGPYVASMAVWLVYGPFSLADAIDARMEFDLWYVTETDYDEVWWALSLDNNQYYGFNVSGSSPAWGHRVFDFSDVTSINVIGQSQVWVAFYFSSDTSVQYEGAYVDNVQVIKTVSCATPAAPTLTAPASAASGVAYDVSWTATSPDNTYELQESADSGFTSPTTFNVTGTSRSFTHTVGSPATYYYRVRATDSCGGSTYTSTWSNTGQTMVTVPSYTLTMSRDGTGTGIVTSSPAGISCGGDCSESYSGGTVVTLTATPDGGSAFAGWSGACSGSASCQVTMSTGRSVTAWFSNLAACVMTVTDQLFTASQLYESCYSIVAGPNVSTTTAAGHLTLRAANQVILRNGFSVGTGARLTVALDPTLAGT